MTAIDYYVSLYSPWVFLGNERLRDLVARRGVTVNVKPAAFPKIFAATGGLPVNERPPERQAYRLMELRRWSTFLGEKINLQPNATKRDEMPGVRLILAVDEAGFDTLPLLTELGRAVWQREEVIADQDVVNAAAERAGMDAVKILAEARPADELDARYEELTAEALQRGVFGAPSYVLPDGDIFWGQDRLNLLDWRLGQLETGKDK